MLCFQLIFQIAVAEAPSRILPDINLYQNKKTVGTGLMDIALLVNNVNQLRHIIDSIDTSSPYFYISLSLVIASIILQVVVGILLAINCRYDVKDCVEICRADRINNWITVLIFLVTAVNVILPALGLPDKGFWLHFSTNLQLFQIDFVYFCL